MAMIQSPFPETQFETDIDIAKCVYWNVYLMISERPEYLTVCCVTDVSCLTPYKIEHKDNTSLL
jgi:hypothetical protein